MKIIFDTADIKEIERFAKLFPDVDCITTNPSLLKQSGVDSEEKFKEFTLNVKEIIPNVNIFFQCFSEDDIDTLIKMNNNIPDVNLIAKISIIPRFYNLIRLAIESKLQTAATTCYDLVQIHQACEMGMDYTMVYHAKNENPNLMREAVEMKKKYDFTTTLVGASFRTKQDIIEAIKSGIDCATIPPHILGLAYFNSQAESDVKNILCE